MKRILWAILALVTSANAAYSQTCWTIGTDGSIELNPERIVLPYSVQVHHAFVDGIHIGRFKDALEAMLNAL